MEMSGLESGDVCVHRQDGKLIIVTGFKPNRPKYPVVFQMAGGKGGQYKGSPDELLGKVGHVNLTEWNRLKGQSVAPPVKQSVQVDWNPWGFKVGQKIKIRTRRGTEEVTFEGYSPRRHKYPVSYTSSTGRAMKCSPSILVT